MDGGGHLQVKLPDLSVISSASKITPHKPAKGASSNRMVPSINTFGPPWVQGMGLVVAAMSEGGDSMSVLHILHMV